MVFCQVSVPNPIRLWRSWVGYGAPELSALSVRRLAGFLNFPAVSYIIPGRNLAGDLFLTKEHCILLSGRSDGLLLPQPEQSPGLPPSTDLICSCSTHTPQLLIKTQVQYFGWFVSFSCCANFHIVLSEGFLFFFHFFF